ncbi:MAG: hypothetical protein LBO64_09800 [Desulfovibrio sp.]|jgi:hypothetical protein|nr:hypothetical protein [Desulfovibrio sp.]
MQRYIQNWPEKFSVGSALIGFYQGSSYAVILGTAACLVSVYLAWRN